MAPKRNRSSQPSQSTQSTTASSAPTPTRPPPAKRLKKAPSAPDQPAPAAPAAPAAAAAAVPTGPVPPSKRAVVSGSLRRLTSGHPLSSLQSGPVRPKSTLSGAKVGGKAKDLRDGATAEEIWVTRKGEMGFGGYLKKAVEAVGKRGCTHLHIHSMGAAIPLALSLAMAIRDALPGGAASSADVGAGMDVVEMKVLTGTHTVADEVEPDDEDSDIHLQTRQKSTVTIELSLPPTLAAAIVAGGGVLPGGTGGERKGGRRRGGGRGRGGRRGGGGSGGRGGRGGP